MQLFFVQFSALLSINCKPLSSGKPAKVSSCVSLSIYEKLVSQNKIRFSCSLTLVLISFAAGEPQYNVEQIMSDAFKRNYML